MGQNILAAFLNILSNISTWWVQRFQANQQQPIKDRKQEQNEVDRQNQIADIVKNKDVDQTRNILSE